MIWRIVFGVFVLLMAVQAIKYYSHTRQQDDQAARLAAATKTIADRDKAAEEKRREGLVNEFSSRRVDILSDLRNKANAKKWDEAHDIAWKFRDVSDPEFVSLAASIHDNWLAAKQKREAEAKVALEKAERARRKREGVKIGMTTEQVLMSNWGKPERVNVTVSARGSSEQWVYSGQQYLYFDNGILTSIQQTR